MNIHTLAKEWLINHKHDEHDPSFEDDLKSLLALFDEALGYNEDFTYTPAYDGNVGEGTLCECGHPYYRHFDTYDSMAPIGCKYCSHYSPSESSAEEYHGNGHCTNFKRKNDN